MSDLDVDRVAQAMVDCHPRDRDHMDWAGWLRECDKPGINGEMAREWVDARRVEARAAIEGVLARVIGIVAKQRTIYDCITELEKLRGTSAPGQGTDDPEWPK